MYFGSVTELVGGANENSNSFTVEQLEGWIAAQNNLDSREVKTSDGVEVLSRFDVAQND